MRVRLSRLKSKGWFQTRIQSTKARLTLNCFPFSPFLFPRKEKDKTKTRTTDATPVSVLQVACHTKTRLISWPMISLQTAQPTQEADDTRFLLLTYCFKYNVDWFVDFHTSLSLYQGSNWGIHDWISVSFDVVNRTSVFLVWIILSDQHGNGYSHRKEQSSCH